MSNLIVKNDYRCGMDFGGTMQWGRYCQRLKGHRWLLSGCGDDDTPQWLRRWQQRQDSRKDK